MADLDSIFKACSSCKKSKPLNEFFKRLCRPLGVTSHCKTCKSEATQRWKIANQDRVKNSIAKAAKKTAMRLAVWRKENPEKVKLTHDKYRVANRKKLAADAAYWRKENEEQCKESKRKWTLLNSEKVRIYSHTRRAKISGSGGCISEGLTQKLFDLQSGKCPCCGQSLGNKYQLDHIMPIALGGANIDSNIQLLRTLCNGQKSAKHPIEFMQQRGFLL